MFEGIELPALVRDINVDQGVKAYKRKLQCDGTLREITDAIRRARKPVSKQARVKGLLPKPKARVGKPSQLGATPYVARPMGALSKDHEGR